MQLKKNMNQTTPEFETFRAPVDIDLCLQLSLPEVLSHLSAEAGAQVKNQLHTH